MLSISINFAYPYLLLLIIAFLIATFIPYFMISKKYRNTRNRIVSIVCHIFASILAVLMLSGMTFVNTNSNPNNEIIILVDKSDSTIQKEDEIDDFIETVIDRARFDKFKVGVVTFGFNQVYAVPLTNDYQSIMSKYDNADLPDQSASDLAAAITYAKTLFTNPNSGKIVLVSDGIETDEKARAVIRTVVASGIKLDTAYIKTSLGDKVDVQINGLKLPDYHINVNDTFQITASVVGNYEGTVTGKLYDNGELVGTQDFELKHGINNLQIEHSFKNEGLHSIQLKLEVKDFILNNNEYTTYLYLEQYNKILIIEQHAGDSVALKSILEENDLFEVTILNVNDQELPKSVDELCNYDEVITNNIANSDLTEEFVEILEEYVNAKGGGLFTVGGKDGSDEAHAYNRHDMVGTLYQQMLPVQAIDYKPPVGVIVIIDRSGSMGSADENGDTLLDWARTGASACLSALSDRDYFGLMTLESEDNVVLEPTPRTQETKIQNAINSIQEVSGGTVFANAIDSAGQQLRALKVVDKKHIIIVSDGYVTPSDVEIYEEYAKNYYETDGITISVVGVQMERPSNYLVLENENTPYTDIETSSAYGKMLRLTKITHGTLHPTTDDDRSRLAVEMREDLKSPDILEVNYEEYNPIVTNMTSSVLSGITAVPGENSNFVLDFTLDGFYGTKVRGSADLVLTGNYNVPLYAQWKYGKGTVGSFMCDLYGDWSSNLLDSDDGKKLVQNIVRALTPTENIKSNEIELSLAEDNYFNTLSVFTDLKEGQYLKAEVKYETNADIKSLSISDTNNNRPEAYTVIALGPENNYSRSKFVLKDNNTYTIVVTKYDKDGNALASNAIYKSLPYSKEYDTYLEQNVDYEDNMKSIARVGNGSYIVDLNDPHESIDSFDVNLVSTFDPRILFSILIIILFLTDFAVRKFKFRWPHEIIRDRKNNK